MIDNLTRTTKVFFHRAEFLSNRVSYVLVNKSEFESNAQLVAVLLFLNQFVIDITREKSARIKVINIIKPSGLRVSGSDKYLVNWANCR